MGSSFLAAILNYFTSIFNFLLLVWCIMSTKFRTKKKTKNDATASVKSGDARNQP